MLSRIECASSDAFIVNGIISKTSRGVVNTDPLAIHFHLQLCALPVHIQERIYRRIGVR
jgi:hypothetical protein